MLNESFGMPDNVERHKMSYIIFNARMREETSVTNHVLYIIELIEHLSKLDFLLYEQLEKDAILNSLPKSYLSFLTHYKIIKSVVNYHDLVGLLQNFEKDHQLHKESVNMVGESSFGHRSFKKGKKNKKNKKKMQSARACQPNQIKKSKSDQSQEECFYCKK